METVKVKLRFQGHTFIYALKPENNLQDLLDDASEKFQKPKNSLALFQQDERTSIETDEKLNLLRCSSPLKLSLKDKRFSGSDPYASKFELEVSELFFKHDYCFTREEASIIVHHSRDSLKFILRNLEIILSFCLKEFGLNESDLKTKAREHRDVVQFCLEHGNKSHQVLAKQTFLKIGRDANEETQRAVDFIQENKKKLIELLDYNLHKTSLVFKVLNKLLNDQFALSHFATEIRDNKLPEGLRSTLFASENPSEEELIQVIQNHPFRWLNTLIIGPDEEQRPKWWEPMIKQVIAFPEKRSVLERIQFETETPKFCEEAQKDIFRIVLRHLSSLPSSQKQELSISSPSPFSSSSSSSLPAPLTIWCAQQPKPEKADTHPGPFFMININQDLSCSLSEVQDSRIAEQGRNILLAIQLARVIPSDPEVQRMFFPFFKEFQDGRKKVDLIEFFLGLDRNIQTFLSEPPRKVEITENNARFWTGILSVIKNKEDFEKVKPLFINKGPTAQILQDTGARILIGLAQSGDYDYATTEEALFTKGDIENYKRKHGL